MNERTRRSNFVVFLLAALFLLASTAFGGLLGGLYVRFVLPRAADGWTGIAQALGGLMIGGALGLVAALVVLAPLVRRGPSALAKSIGWVAAGVAAVVVVLVLARPERPGDPAPRLDDGVQEPKAVTSEADGG
jgi:hypothetical protein